MSCAGKGYGTNPQSDDYLNANFSSYIPNNNTNLKQSTRNCRKSRESSYPSFTPVLDNLSVTSSVSGVYSNVYVNGSNYLPNGTTFIQFGNMGYISVIFYSSFNLSFVVPLNASPGSYEVKVVNLYNGNFSPEINQSNTGNNNYSQPIIYTIT